MATIFKCKFKEKLAWHCVTKTPLKFKNKKPSLGKLPASKPQLNRPLHKLPKQALPQLFSHKLPQLFSHKLPQQLQ